MWIVSKSVGIFTHYLSVGGVFQPIADKASYFPSKEMAESMAKIHGGKVKSLK